jgi:hypothetical protein
MSSVNEYIGANLSTNAPPLDLHEIQATVLRLRPAPYFGSHEEPARRRIHGIETFNVLRGGEYFFMPSLTALKWLADLHK